MLNPPRTSPLLPYHREILPNGVSLLIKENHSVPLVAVDLWVATGSSHERENETGISHFLEHLFFKGTPSRPVGTMDRQIKSLGGYNNAATSYDFTHYYVVLPSEHAGLALEILTDALLNMELPPSEIERERNVILEEIARKEDSPLGKLYDEFLNRVFAGTPYDHSILGTPESLAEFRRDHFLNYRARNYVPGNLHIAVSGSVEPPRIKEKVWQLVEAMAPAEAPHHAPLPDLNQGGRTQFEISKDVQQTYLCMGMKTPAIQGTREEAALDLISAILGDGRSSRLVYRLTERSGLCSSISSFYWTLDRIGLYGIEACYDGDDEKEALDIIDEELARIRTEPIPDREVERAKAMLLTSHQFDLEKNSSLAGVLGRHSANGKLDSAVDYEERIRSLSGDIVQDAFNRFCLEGNLVLGFVRPENRA